MTDLALLGLGLGTALVLVFAVWVVQLRTRDASPVDVAWTASLGIIAVEYAIAGSAPVFIRIIMAAIAVVWSGRLAIYLALRMRGQPEDSRYAAARKSWGERADLYMLAFFVLQAVIAFVLSLAFWVVATMGSAPPVVFIVLAVLIGAGSVFGEGVADAQLARFKADPANGGWVCRRGLWYYSRHPNYFFEALHWVAYAFLAVGSVFWPLTLVSPILMALLLLKVSGVPTVESANAAGKRWGHDEYVATTNAFIPWPPKDKSRT